MSKRSCCVAKKLILVTGLRSFVHPWLQMTWSLHSLPLPRTQPPHSSLPRWHRTPLQCPPPTQDPFSPLNTSSLEEKPGGRNRGLAVGETLIKKNPVHMVPGPRRHNHVKIGSLPLASERLGRAEPAQGGELMPGLPLLLRCRAFCPRQLGEAGCPRSQPELHIHPHASTSCFFFLFKASFVLMLITAWLRYNSHSRQSIPSFCSVLPCCQPD